jgi:methyl-accepting chemotaxis protein
MTVALRATHAQAEEERRSNILSAVAQAETVGRSIHLIAFNAAIEAARVGDAGRGFKVISSEVQLLAAKTQTLLKDIADTLRD